METLKQTYKEPKYELPTSYSLPNKYQLLSNSHSTDNSENPEFPCSWRHLWYVPMGCHWMYYDALGINPLSCASLVVSHVSRLKRITKTDLQKKDIVLSTARPGP